MSAILACPSCDSRYDVAGYAPGQRFRCRCGTVFTPNVASAQAGLLACPHCGAGVAPTSSRCEHCSHNLLVKACPRCLSRVFHGHKHCPECGAELDLAAVGERTELPCPRCTTTLQAKLVGDIVIDECGQCLGLFLDHVAIKRVVTDRQQARAEAILGALPRREVPTTPRDGKMYVKCPVCRVVMNRKLFATGSGVIIDVCRTHGTFFDAGELPAIVDFVMQGGLEQAQRKDMERMVDDARRHRDDARAAEIAAARTMARHDPHSSGGAFVDLLFSLWG